MNSKACEELDAKVIKTGLCTLCGACVGNCPYLAAYEGRVLLTDICDLPQGRCLTACPRISLDLNELSEVVFGVPYPEDGLGTARYVVMARTTDSKIRASAQDAGAVTALIKFAMQEGFIDSAILTRFEDKSWPRGIVASNHEQILKCSGSSYLAAPTIESFNQAIQNPNHRSIGFIGTPCQVMSLVKMRTAPAEVSQDMDRLKLIVGLFCTWALAYPDFGSFLEKRISDPVVRYEIPPHPENVLSAYTDKERFSFAVEQVLPFVRFACRFCLDLTAEFADLSVGGGRGEVLNWNTVVVRTDRGMRLLDSAIKKGVIETAPIPEGNLSRLKSAACNRKKRAIENIIQRTGYPDDLLYLKGRPGIVKRLVAECRERSL